MAQQATQLSDMEAALLQRATKFAQEHLDAAHHGRERILQESKDRLRLLEEREIIAAKSQAERNYRQRIQAADIRLQADFDRLRWTLVQATLGELRERLARLATDESAYLPLLVKFIGNSVAAIERNELVVHLNQQDSERLAPTWEAIVKENFPGKPVRLHSEPYPCIGGVLVESADGAIRIDNTFEGRIERMQDELQRILTERLFGGLQYRGGQLGE